MLLATLLEQLNISKASCARYFKVHPNTVSEWCKSEPPESVLLHLEEINHNRTIYLKLKNA